MAWGENDRYSTCKNNALIASKSIAQLTPYPRVFQHNHTLTRDGEVLGEKLNSRFEYENRINEYYHRNNYANIASPMCIPTIIKESPR